MMAERSPATRSRPARLGRPSGVSRVRGAALAAAVQAIGLFGPAGCGTAEPPMFDPRAIEASERRMAMPGPVGASDRYPGTLQATPTPDIGATRPTTQSYLRNLPTTGRSYAERETIPLTLREVMTRAVLYNADVKVAGYDPAINASRTLEAEAQFDVSYFFNARTERADPGLSTTDVAPNQIVGFTDKTKINTLETGFSQKLPWGGQGRLLYGLTWNEVDSLPASGSNNGSQQRFWQNQIRLEVTQPLLQNFGADINSARVEIARLDQRISILDFRKTLEEQLSLTEQAYWQLYQAVKIVQIQENLLSDTIETYRVLRERFEKGLDASEVSVSQAQSSIKARQADLIRAKQQVRDASDELKRRMNDPQFPMSSDLVIWPTEEPLKEPVTFDYASAIDSASFNRFELGQQRARIEQARTAQRVAQNNLLPRLDLVSRVGVVGLGDTTGEAFQNNSDFNNPNWSFGIEFEYPIGNRAAKAVFRRAELQRQQAIEQYRGLLTQVSQDVRTALNSIDSNWQQSIARQQARLASTRQLSLLQLQQDQGSEITPSFVQIKLQAQEELANASREEVAALAGYSIAIQQLERSKGTLLKYNNVQLKEDPSQTYMRRAWSDDGLNK